MALVRSSSFMTYCFLVSFSVTEGRGGKDWRPLRKGNRGRTTHQDTPCQIRLRQSSSPPHTWIRSFSTISIDLLTPPRSNRRVIHTAAEKTTGGRGLRPFLFFRQISKWRRFQQLRSRNWNSLEILFTNSFSSHLEKRKKRERKEMSQVELLTLSEKKEGKQKEDSSSGVNSKASQLPPPPPLLQQQQQGQGQPPRFDYSKEELKTAGF